MKLKTQIHKEENQTAALSRISIKMVKFYYMSGFRLKNGKVSIISLLRQCENVSKISHVDHRLRRKKTFPRRKRELAFRWVALDHVLAMGDT